MSTYRCWMVQENPILGDLRHNLNRAKAWIRHASEHTSVQLVVFPECFLTGYPLQDLVLRPGFLTDVEKAMQDLSAFVAQQKGPSVIMGAPLSGNHMPYNAAYFLRRDGSRSLVLKSELPNNDVFDERRTFAHADPVGPIQDGDWKIGVMICEDMWHHRVAQKLAGEGADLLCVINGSPMEKGKRQVRHAHARRRVRETGLPLMYLNLVGGQDELVFDGHSFVLNQEGKLIAETGMNIGALSVEWSKVDDEVRASPVVAISPPELGWVGQSIPSLFTMQPEAELDEQMLLYRTLVMGLHDYVEKNQFKKVLLGLSGGLDSALVMAIAVDALGPDRVIPLMLPAEWTGQESQSLAEEMAQRVGSKYASIAVHSIVKALETSTEVALTALNELDLNHIQGGSLAKENIQARARGNLIMALSNAMPGVLVLSTGNKSEMSVGYATLYGDMSGGFNPIKDLYKTEVRALSHWRNAHHQAWMKGGACPIPELIIARPPTAELAPNQTDERALGSYEGLDAVLRGLIEELLSGDAAQLKAEEVLGIKLPAHYGEKIAGLVKRAEYKRRQAPPGIKVSGRSFGFGWRYPITNRSDL